MTLKSRITSFAAATALALSMTTGVLADTSVNTTIQLIEIPCTASITTGDIDFGVWQYHADINQYLMVEGPIKNPTITVQAIDGSVHQSVTKCDVSLIASDMTNSETENTIPIRILDDFGNDGTDLQLAPGKSASFAVLTNTVLNNTLDPLTYTGTISVTSETSSN